MNQDMNPARRAWLLSAAAGLTLTPLGVAHGADAALLSEDDPAAKALAYVEDAGRSKEAQPGANCSNCVLYADTPGAGQGACKLFTGKLVKAAGWCSSWSDL